MDSTNNGQPLNFRNVHRYLDYSSRRLDLNLVTKKVASFFPNCSLEVRPPFLRYATQSADSQGFDLDDTAQSVDRIRISEMKAPAANSHIRYCDWRYHVRAAVICGTPSIISVRRIIEGHTKTKEFYIKQMQYGLQYGVNFLEDKRKQEFANMCIFITTISASPIQQLKTSYWHSFLLANGLRFVIINTADSLAAKLNLFSTKITKIM